MVKPDEGASAPLAEPVSHPVTELVLTGTDAGSPSIGTGHRPRRKGRLSRRRLKDWRVRTRLLLLIAIPTLTALVFGVIRIASATQSALAFQRAEERAILASTISQLTQRLETERDQTIYYIALSGNGRVGDLAKARSAATSGAAAQYRGLHAFYLQTDRTAAQFRARLAQFHGAYSAAAQQQVSAALAGLNNLPYLRQASTKTRLYPLAVEQKYADLIDKLIVVDDQTAQGTGDPALAQTADVLGLVSRMKEAASEQRAMLAAALLQGSLSSADASVLSAAQASQQSAQQAFNLAATGPQRAQWNNAVSGSYVYIAASEEQRAAALQAHAHSLVGDPLTASDFYDAMSGGIDQMGSVERALAQDVITRSNSLRGSAVAYALIVGLAVLILLALALFFTVMVARSMVRPLRQLRAGALEVAGVRLPETVRRMSEGGKADAPLAVEPIDVDSTDEIGEVARAFDQVHQEAVRLASNEAALRSNVNAMFVNLSRRSQSLAERQIRLIDDLERGEQDPERLGNLFQMDHLATRMRRNSENLLVLAGHDVSRRWTQAVGLLDVLRAAASEIERYERVTLNVQPGIAVRGEAVTAVVHLLAELVENATAFSAADTPVNVAAHLLNDGGVLLDITDQGVGMRAEEIAYANWRLDTTPVVDVAVSRRMGLFVVARLAARHGIRVRLRSASMGGLTALVWLPDEVITYETPLAPPRPHKFEVTDPDGGATASPDMTAIAEADTDNSGADVLASTALDAEALDPGAPGVNGLPAPAHLASAPPLLDPPQSRVAKTAETSEEFALQPADPAMPSSSSESPLEQSAVVPPVSAEEPNRLPIFESIESDWFRRSRHRDDGSVPVASTGMWSSPADEGWRAAEVARSPVSGGETVAGLPRRQPKANLVPGSAATTTVSTAMPARSAAQTGERLASFQRGIQEARAAADGDGEPGEQEDDTT